MLKSQFGYEHDIERILKNAETVLENESASESQLSKLVRDLEGINKQRTKQE